VRTVLRQAETAVLLYSAPEKRADTRRRLADGLGELLRAAAPGSDSQLQLLRAYASAAVGDDHLDVVRRVLDSEQGIDGVEVDTDLRWHLLQRLVSAGRVEDAEIDRELDRDDTATGRRHAAAALAARPQPEAKEEAWSSVIDSDQLPNAIQTAVIGGFAQPDQVEMLRPYVARYFAALTDVWAGRTNETAQNIVIGLFPSLLAEQATLDAADAWLAANADAVPALRRLVLESRDGVARALRVQARDAVA
jgi:aminopeptidase N